MAGDQERRTRAKRAAGAYVSRPSILVPQEARKYCRLCRRCGDHEGIAGIFGLKFKQSYQIGVVDETSLSSSMALRYRGYANEFDFVPSSS